MKKKILHIVEAFGGGVFTYLVALANATCEEFDVTIAYALRPQTPPGFERLLDERVHLIALKEAGREINLWKDFKSAREIRSIFKQVNPDTVHLHSSKAGLLGRLVINCRRNHVLYTPHGFAFLKQDDSKLTRTVYKWMEKAAALKGGNIVCVSKGEYEATYVNNGIDTDALDHLELRQVTSENRKEPVIGTLGRICYQKAPGTFQEVAEAFPELSFMWIGEGEMRNLLTGRNIEITGWQEPEEARKYLNQLQIFLLPSLWEGLPISLLEAMYLKKICIVSDVIGNRDVIEHGRNGFVAKTKEDYIRIIGEIRSGQWDLEKITDNARRDVEEFYNIRVMCESYAKIYRDGCQV